MSYKINNFFDADSKANVSSFCLYVMLITKPDMHFSIAVKSMKYFLHFSIKIDV